MILGNSKNLRFSLFFGKFDNFCFQNRILDQISPRIIKNDFSTVGNILEVLKMIYIDFLSELLEF